MYPITPPTLSKPDISVPEISKVSSTEILLYSSEPINPPVLTNAFVSSSLRYNTFPPLIVQLVAEHSPFNELFNLPTKPPT